jgi:hypothetical protein
VVVTADGQIIAESYFACRASGNNYLAEALAGVAATLCVPSSVDLDLVTDAKSYMQALEKGRVRDWAQGPSRRATLCLSGRGFFVLPARSSGWSARAGATPVSSMSAHTRGAPTSSRG